MTCVLSPGDVYPRIQQKMLKLSYVGLFELSVSSLNVTVAQMP